MHRWLAWGAPEFVLERQQWVPSPVAEVFPFFENPQNLSRITPSWLRFDVKRVTPDRIAPGTLIDYRLKWLGIPYSWRTLIESWNPPACFVDTMLNGPYILWHHTHTFEGSEGGTLLRDRVRYRIPFGPIGVVLHALLIRRQLASIFDFRAERVAELFSGGQVMSRPPK